MRLDSQSPPGCAACDAGRGYAGLVQQFDGPPFRFRADDGGAAVEHVFEHLAPAHATVGLDEVAPARDLELDGAPVLDRAMHLAFHGHQPVEGIFLRQMRAEMFVEFEHARSLATDGTRMEHG